MNVTQNISLLSLKNIIFFLVIVGLIYLFATSLTNKRFEEIELNTREQISDQQALLAAIAETTARNGADAVTESIVKDCAPAERIKFDTMLGQLDAGLTNSQLVELESLFGRCAAFFSEKKAVMVARLTREIEIYENYVNQLSVIKDKEMSPSFSVEKWQALAAGERKQSELFAELVNLQDQIISALLEGKTANSPEIKEILQRVVDVKETQIVTSKQIANIRSELIPL